MPDQPLADLADRLDQRGENADNPADGTAMCQFAAEIRRLVRHQAEVIAAGERIQQVYQDGEHRRSRELGDLGRRATALQQQLDDATDRANRADAERQTLADKLATIRDTTAASSRHSTRADIAYRLDLLARDPYVMASWLAGCNPRPNTTEDILRTLASQFRTPEPGQPDSINQADHWITASGIPTSTDDIHKWLDDLGIPTPDRIHTLLYTIRAAIIRAGDAGYTAGVASGLGSPSRAQEPEPSSAEQGTGSTPPPWYAFSVRVGMLQDAVRDLVDSWPKDHRPDLMIAAARESGRVSVERTRLSDAYLAARLFGDADLCAQLLGRPGDQQTAQDGTR